MQCSDATGAALIFWGRRKVIIENMHRGNQRQTKNKHKRHFEIYYSITGLLNRSVYSFLNLEYNANPDTYFLLTDHLMLTFPLCFVLVE